MREIDWSEAEQLLGKRVDRRRSYATTDDGQPDELMGAVVFSIGSWTDSCSGCTDTEDGHPVGHYPTDPKHGCLIGAGCEECGYTGKRRMSMWLPYTASPPSPCGEEGE